MALTGILRIGLVQLRVLDLEETPDFYVNMMGLNKVGTTEDGRIMLKGYDEFDHHSVVLRKADSAGIDLFAFKVDSPKTLEELKGKLEAYGLKVDEVPANSDQPGFGKRYGFTLPTGHRMELYAEVEMASQTPMTHNPHPWEEPPRGMRAQYLDHLLAYGPNVPETEKILTEVLGMQTAEAVNTEAEDGNHFAVWITCSNKPHDIAFVERADPGKLHHVGFYLEDWNDVGNAADYIGRYNIRKDLGPTRHGITRGQTIYFWEPSGNRLETFSGGYKVFPDHPMRVWDFDMVGKGIFYYEGELNEAFLSVYT